MEQIMSQNQASRCQLNWLWNLLESNGYDPDAMAEIQCKKEYADLTKNDLENILRIFYSDYDEPYLMV